jgi:SAM-dependent methyltransferase
MNKTQFLSINQHVIKDKIVLDLACHIGVSTKIIQDLGAKYVYGLEGRENLVQTAKQNVDGNVEFIVGDMTDSTVILPLVEKSQTIVCIGSLYHLYDHFRFFQYIFQPHVEYCIISTLFGPESINPEMWWGFENTHDIYNGFYKNLPIIPHGTPNLSWIVNSAKIFGFECDWIHCYGKKVTKAITQITVEEYLSVAGNDWPPYENIVSGQKIPVFVKQELDQMLHDYPSEDRRMILRLYNSKLIKSKPIQLKENYKWPF